MTQIIKHGGVLPKEASTTYLLYIRQYFSAFKPGKVHGILNVRGTFSSSDGSISTGSGGTLTQQPSSALFILVRLTDDFACRDVMDF